MDNSQINVIFDRLNALKPRLLSGDRVARKETLHLSQKLTVQLEDPASAAVSLAYSPMIPIAARICVQLGVFKFIADHGKPIASRELASLSGGEELLVIRVLRAMTSIGFVDEVDELLWRANPITRAMASEGIAAGHRLVGEFPVGAGQKAPKYLLETGYRCPTDAKAGFMQYAFQTTLPTFQFFSTMPRVLNDFDLWMGNTMGARDYWMDWYPIEERLIREAAAAEEGSALLVDVGGGKGHDVEAFRRKYPNQKGRLILQDLASVTDRVQGLDPAIEVMAYDFFTNQPVKGARAYFLHHVLHDWPDSKCMEILERVKAAMKPGYSRLLLHEMIIPNRGASAFHAMHDLAMMMGNLGMERTETQWRKLLEDAGFVIVKIWLPPQDDGDGIVEAIIQG